MTTASLESQHVLPSSLWMECFDALMTTIPVTADNEDS